jgi:Protein of unknown function (DUF4238)
VSSNLTRTILRISMNEQNHHYISRFILSPWATNKGKIFRYCWDVKTNKWYQHYRLVAAAGTAYVTNLNKLRLQGTSEENYLYAVEKYHAKTETKFAPLFERMRNDPFETIDPLSKRLLVKFIVSMVGKNPQLLDISENIIHNETVNMYKKLILMREDFPSPLKEMYQKIAEMPFEPPPSPILDHIYNLSRMSPIQIFESLERDECLTWPQWIIDSEKELYFSDFPVMGNARFELIMAITPHKLWVCSKRLLNDPTNYQKLCDIYNRLLIRNFDQQEKYLYSSLPIKNFEVVEKEEILKCARSSTG